MRLNADLLVGVQAGFLMFVDQGPHGIQLRGNWTAQE